MIAKESKSGFTLVELIIVTAILSTTLVGLISLFLYTSVQGEMAGNKSLAVDAAQNKIEEIRNHAYSLISTDYASGGTPGNKFSVSGMTGQGVIYIDTTTAPCNTELLCLEVDVSWRNKYGRILGEDTNLNGTIDSGEDVNGNGRLDAPVKIMGMITRR